MKKVLSAVAALAVVAAVVVWMVASQARLAQARLATDAGNLANDLARKATAQAVVALDLTCDGEQSRVAYTIPARQISAEALAEWVPAGCALDRAEITGWRVTPPDVSGVALEGATVTAAASAIPETGEVAVTITATGRTAWQTYTVTRTGTYPVVEPETADRRLRKAVEEALPVITARLQPTEPASVVAVVEEPDVSVHAPDTKPDAPAEPAPVVEATAPAAQLAPPSAVFGGEKLEALRARFSDGGETP